MLYLSSGPGDGIPGLAEYDFVGFIQGGEHHMLGPGKHIGYGSVEATEMTIDQFVNQPRLQPVYGLKGEWAIMYQILCLTKDISSSE